jgi:hypothetical protein
MVVETSEAPTGWVSRALDWCGLRWPEGDTGQIKAAGNAWLALGRSLREQYGTATAAAQAVWSPPNRGGVVEDFQQWWSAESGPGANLLRAAGAVESIGAALLGLATEIVLLRVLFVVNLGMLGLTLAGLGLADVGTAGLATPAAVAAGAAAANEVRRRLIRRIQIATARIAAQLIVALLVRSALELKTAPVQEPVTVRDPDEDKEPKPGPKDPPPPPLPPWWRDDERPRCGQNPEPFLPRDPIVLGGADPRNNGGRILRITQIDGPVRTVTVEGIMGPAIDERLGGPQRDYQILAQDMGFPPGEYDACHSYGPGFGSEAAAGMGLCPSTVNQRPGQMFDLEERLRNLYQRTSADGGWVELTTTTQYQPKSAWPDPTDPYYPTGDARLPRGDNLLGQVNYDATVCRDGRAVENYRFGISIQPPRMRDGAFTPGMSTVYGQPPP